MRNKKDDVQEGGRGRVEGNEEDIEAVAEEGREERGT